MADCPAALHITAICLLKVLKKKQCLATSLTGFYWRIGASYGHEANPINAQRNPDQVD